MIDATGALDVYFEDQIEILVTQPDSFPTAKAKEVLADAELEFTRIERRSR